MAKTSKEKINNIPYIRNNIIYDCSDIISVYIYIYIYKNKNRNSI